MTVEKIRSKFFKTTDLSVMETLVNGFTDQFSPGNILDVQFFCVTEKILLAENEVTTLGYSRDVHTQSHRRNNEEQRAVDRYIVMIVYMVTDDEDKNQLLG